MHQSNADSSTPSPGTTARRAPAARHAPRTLLLIAGLASASCSDGILAPAPRTAPPLPAPSAPARAFAPAVSDVVVASAALPIPETNTYGTGAQPWTLVHTFAESGYYEVRTSGVVTYVKNANAANTGCGLYCVGVNVDGGPDPGGTVGGAGRPEGDLRTYITVTTGAAPDAGDYGISASATADGQVVTLVAAGSRKFLWARRSGIAGVRSCWGTCGDMPDGPTGWFLLDSKEKIEAKRVIPLQVAPDKPEFVQGEVVHWTTARHSAVREKTYWFWTPEGGYRTQISCSGPSCSYAPPGSGTMLAVSHYYENGDLVEVSASTAAKAIPPRLILNCPASVQRGSSMTCNAVGQGGALSNIEWKFTDDSLNAAQGPADSTRWGGTIVIGGTMLVMAKVGGVPDSASARISVSARAWPKMVVTAVDVGHANLPDPPAKIGDLGETMFPHLRDPMPVRSVDDGPNKGWSYLDQAVTHLTAIVKISRAFGPAHTWFQQQHSGTISDPNGQLVPACTQADIPALETVTREHEGLSQGSTLSHVAGYALFFRDYDPQVEVERFMRHTSQMNGFPFIDFAQADFQTYVLTPLGLDGRAKHTRDGGLVPFPTFHCYPRF